MRLSICIPTYNRAEYLPMLLDSIIGQTGYGCELEVIISDNASSDDTSAVAESYRERFARFVYHRADTNQGADRNFLKAVALASGDFCWLMGSDDLLEPGGLAAVDAALAANPDVAGVFVRNNSYSVDMDTKVPMIVGGGLPSRSIMLTGSDLIFSTIGEYIGYISANIVRRDLWNEVVTEKGLDAYFNAWIHVYVMGRMMQRRPAWYFVADRCVAWRSGNDSFLADGQYRRLEIDVAGYEQITRGLFGHQTPVYRFIMRRILEHARFRILHAKAHDAPASFFRKVRLLMNRHYRNFPAYWLTTYPLLAVPAPLIKTAREVYTKTLKPIRSARANRQR